MNNMKLIIFYIAILLIHLGAVTPTAPAATATSTTNNYSDVAEQLGHAGWERKYGPLVLKFTVGKITTVNSSLITWSPDETSPNGTSVRVRRDWRDGLTATAIVAGGTLIGAATGGIVGAAAGFRVGQAIAVGGSFGLGAGTASLPHWMQRKKRYIGEQPIMVTSSNNAIGYCRLLYQVLDHSDRDHDGRLSPAEHKIPATLLSEIDANNNGFLEPNEFSNSCFPSVGTALFHNLYHPKTRAKRLVITYNGNEVYNSDDESSSSTSTDDDYNGYSSIAYYVPSTQVIYY